MVGILVHGNNHFILSGPEPDEAVALALARHWSIIQIGETKSSSFGQWEIRSKEFRGNLEWAVIVPGEREPSQGVVELLGELSARGVDPQAESHCSPINGVGRPHTFVAKYIGPLFFASLTHEKHFRSTRQEQRYWRLNCRAAAILCRC